MTRSFNRFAADEGFEVAAELREVFGGSTGRIGGHVVVDEGLRHRRVHVPRGCLPDQHSDRRPGRSASSKLQTEPHGDYEVKMRKAGARRESCAMAGLMALMISTSGSLAFSSIGQ